MYRSKSPAGAPSHTPSGEDERDTTGMAEIDSAAVVGNVSAAHAEDDVHRAGIGCPRGKNEAGRPARVRKPEKKGSHPNSRKYFPAKNPTVLRPVGDTDSALDFASFGIRPKTRPGR